MSLNKQGTLLGFYDLAFLYVCVWHGNAELKRIQDQKVPSPAIPSATQALGVTAAIGKPSNGNHGAYNDLLIKYHYTPVTSAELIYRRHELLAGLKLLYPRASKVAQGNMFVPTVNGIAIVQKLDEYESPDAWPRGICINEGKIVGVEKHLNDYFKL